MVHMLVFADLVWQQCPSPFQAQGGSFFAPYLHLCTVMDMGRSGACETVHSIDDMCLLGDPPCGW